MLQEIGGLLNLFSWLIGRAFFTESWGLNVPHRYYTGEEAEAENK